jgi:hypothetical protein
MSVRPRLHIWLTLLLLGGLLAPSNAFSQDSGENKSKSKYEQLIEGKKKLTGMWTLYHSDQKLLAELSPAAVKKEYIVIPSISRGISKGMVLGGMSWGFGDDVIWAFRQTEDKLFILQRNVRFRAKPNTPEASAVELAYSDSVLFALPIQTKSPSGGILVDMTSVFMNDDLEIGSAIGPGFRFQGDRSTWSKIKAFEENVELQLNSVYAGTMRIDTVPNSKGVQVGVHYSISILPPVGSTGYKPRLADNRIGYFLTAIKDFSDKSDPENFVRYINRWNLQKEDPDIALSPPKEPILFYVENTVPVYLRPTVFAGIREWNKAFEKLGFSGAIEVRQQPDDPNFDPENIRYNTFRWMTAEAGFAMGPSRVDPRTGQILDADIIFDASFLNSWSRRWETFRPEDVAQLAPNWSPQSVEEFEHYPQGHRHAAHCTLCQEMQRQSGYAAAAMMATGVSKDGSLPEEFIHQGLKEVVMHEVGHTLGLRHNFKASAWKSLEEIGDPDKGPDEPNVASVMDYSPANLVLDEKKQGLYYSQTIGPYDYWAIEYGYKPVKGNEAEELKKIASRSGEPGLAYATDEDTRSIDPDPLSNRFDLGKDPLEYVARQIKQTSELMPKVVENTVKDGEGYERARQAFGLLMGEYWRSAGFAARFPGGVYISRHHKGDEDAEPPFKVVEPEKQREAMTLLAESAFAPPTLDGGQLNYLAASRWSHWGTRNLTRLDYPIHDTVLQMQDMILSQVLRTTTLERILDNEFKVEDEDAYTLAEHLQLIVGSIFAEWDQKPDGEYSNREPKINSFRRNLQRSALRRLAAIVSHGQGAPTDARTLTRMHLRTLKSQGEKLLKNKKVILDDYTRAHLEDSIAQIDKVLNAELALPMVN